MFDETRPGGFEVKSGFGCVLFLVPFVYVPLWLFAPFWVFLVVAVPTGLFTLGTFLVGFAKIAGR